MHELVDSKELFTFDEEKAMKELEKPLSDLVGTEVLAPVMLYNSVLTETLVFAKGVITYVRVDRKSYSVELSVKLKEPVEWYDGARTTRATYVLKLTYKWEMHEAIGFVVLLAMNKHLEEKMLTALESVGYNVEKLREAVRMTREAYDKWFGKH